MGPMLWSGEVNAGDVLVVPRGMYHHAEVPRGKMSGSLHFTLSPLPTPGWLAWEDFIKALLSSVVNDEAYSKDVQTLAHALGNAVIGGAGESPAAFAARSIWHPRYNDTRERQFVAGGVREVLEAARTSLWRAAESMGAAAEKDLRAFRVVWPELIERVTNHHFISTALQDPRLTREVTVTRTKQDRTLRGTAASGTGWKRLPIVRATTAIERLDAGPVVITVADAAARAITKGSRGVDIRVDTTKVPPGFFTIHAKTSHRIIAVLQEHLRGFNFVTNQEVGAVFMAEDVPTLDPIAATAIVRLCEEMGLVKPQPLSSSHHTLAHTPTDADADNTVREQDDEDENVDTGDLEFPMHGEL